MRANYNQLLDVARKTYRENVTDIIELQDELAKEHNLPLSLQYQGNGGFILVLKKGDIPSDIKSLPAPFINVSTKKNGRWTCSHLELVRIFVLPSQLNKARLQKKRNTRLQDSLDEALLLSDQ